MLTLLLSPDVLSVALPLLAGALAFLLRKVFGDRAAKAESNLLLGVRLAYLCVSEVAIRSGNKVDDKLALGLKILKDFLESRGQSLSPADVEQAKLLFQAMHGVEKMGFVPEVK